MKNKKILIVGAGPGGLAARLAVLMYLSIVIVAVNAQLLKKLE